MSKVTKIDAAAARAMYPFVVGTINGADLHAGFAILDMGPKAYAVIVRGEWRACCPSYAYAKRAGVKFANEVA